MGSGEEQAPEGVDPTIPTAARMYDFMLGGTHNFESDRAAVKQVTELVPELDDLAWANRGFHQRAVRWLVGEAGVRQFLDLGSGLPTQMNTHQVAQSVDPDARVVYVDYDPAVAAHSRELGDDPDRTAFITADLKNADAVLGAPEFQRVIDLDQPVGILMSAVFHYVLDSHDPDALLAKYVGAVPSGSYLGMSHMTGDLQPEQSVARIRAVLSRTTEIRPRTKAEVAALFEKAGLELVPPYAGAALEPVPGGVWGAEDPVAADTEGGRWVHCAVGRKP